MFLSKFIYVIDHKTNDRTRTFFTNHNNAGFGLIAYHIYVRVFLALSPKMAPNSKKHPQNTSGTHPIKIIGIKIIVPIKSEKSLWLMVHISMVKLPAKKTN